MDRFNDNEVDKQYLSNDNQQYYHDSNAEEANIINNTTDLDDEFLDFAISNGYLKTDLTLNDGKFYSSFHENPTSIPNNPVLFSDSKHQQEAKEMELYAQFPPAFEQTIGGESANDSQNKQVLLLKNNQRIFYSNQTDSNISNSHNLMNSNQEGGLRYDISSYEENLGPQSSNPSESSTSNRILPMKIHEVETATAYTYPREHIKIQNNHAISTNISARSLGASGVCNYIQNGNDETSYKENEILTRVAKF